jgi:hypothetical protein
MSNDHSRNFLKLLQCGFPILIPLLNLSLFTRHVSLFFKSLNPLIIYASLCKSLANHLSPITHDLSSQMPYSKDGVPAIVIDDAVKKSGPAIVWRQILWRAGFQLNRRLSAT